jgi:hypothetical protein
VKGASSRFHGLRARNRPIPAGSADTVAMANKNPQIAPARILPRQPDHKRDDLLVQAAPVTTSLRVGPPAHDQLPVPTQQR